MNTAYHIPLLVVQIRGFRVLPSLLSFMLQQGPRMNPADLEEDYPA